MLMEELTDFIFSIGPQFSKNLGANI